MRILFISTEDAKYGAPKSMLMLITLLSKKHGIECVLLTKNHNVLSQWCDEYKIKNFSFFYSDIMAGDSYEKWYLNTAKHFYKKILYISGKLIQPGIKRMKIDFSSFDIIHSNTNRIEIGAYLAGKYKIPHVWHLREMDEGVKNMHYYKHGWQEFMNQNAASFIAITEAVKDSWIRHGIDSDKIEVIYNGIAPENVSVKKDNYLKNDRMRIVSVGRIERAKGQEDLIRALCRLPEDIQVKVEVDFLGEAYPDYKARLNQILSNEECRVKVNYCGYCDNIGMRIQDYDIGITCSPAEAFGRTTVEYMMAGLLVIATDTGANPELIVNGESGILYEQGNPIMLADILIRVLNGDIDIQSLSLNGYKRALAKFTAEINADRIYELYKKLI